MARVMQFVFVLLIICFGLAFHVRNDQLVTLDFYFYAIEVPLSWSLVAAFALGAGLGFLVMVNSVVRVHTEKRRLAKQHEIATEEIVNLRAIPLKDGP